MRNQTSAGERLETVVLVLILLVVGFFSGAASFTHVHDWTMAHTPAGRGEWFGWVNAVISELVPIASLLVMRRRRRTGQSVAYPATLLVVSLALSITAQLAVAKPGLSGGVVSVVPALAFAALAKLVLGKPAEPQPRNPYPASSAPPVPVRYQGLPVDQPETPSTTVVPTAVVPTAVVPTVAATLAPAVSHDGLTIGRLTR